MNTKKAKENFAENHCHNMLRAFNVLTNLPVTESKTMGSHYLQTWLIRVASPVAKLLQT